MTEHTRIAVPEEPSLLERAAPRFGFSAPPVPKLPEATFVSPPVAAPIVPPIAQLRPAVVAPFAPTPLVAPQPSFAGDRHPMAAV